MVLHASRRRSRSSRSRATLRSDPRLREQKINASLACNTQSTNGNPAPTIKTVENFLGIDINHIVIVDFDGSADFNTLGGVRSTSSTPMARRAAPSSAATSTASSRAASHWKIQPGEVTLEGDKALSRAQEERVRPLRMIGDRAARQQPVLDGIKGRLTSVTCLPHTTSSRAPGSAGTRRRRSSATWVVHAPQVAIAAIPARRAERARGEGGAAGPAGSIFCLAGRCEEAVRKLTGSDLPYEAECSPG